VTRSIRPRLYDIDTNIEIILVRVKGRRAGDLEVDLDLRYVILHALMIIAEAVHKLPDAVIVAHPGIPWGDIIGMGRHIKHEYHRLDLGIVWDAATIHLPKLQPVVKQLLVAAEETGAPV
jgi:uncharacterized protein with HEPN domain